MRIISYKIGDLSYMISLEYRVDYALLINEIIDYIKKYCLN